jgi:hypothetical protein
MTWRIFFPELCKISPVNHLILRGYNIIMKKLKKYLTQVVSYFANSFAWPEEFGAIELLQQHHRKDTRTNTFTRMPSSDSSAFYPWYWCFSMLIFIHVRL